MSNADLELVRFEQELHAALAWNPSGADRTRIRQRITDVIAISALTRSKHRSFPRLALIAAASLLLLGAASAVSLLQRTAQLRPGTEVAYERGVILNLSETVGAWTVNLERGYADPNELVLMFTVRGPQGASQAVVRADVVDATGRSYLETAGGDNRDLTANAAASVSSYQVPGGAAGTLDLTATVPQLQSYGDGPAPQGPWQFHFQVPVHPAVLIDPNLTVTAAGVPITFQELQVTATAVRVQLAVDLTAIFNDQWNRWALVGTLQQAGRPAETLEWAPLPPAWIGQPKSEIKDILDESEAGWIQVRQTFSGTDAPTGRWTLTIDELTGADGSGAVRSVSGPWVFTVDIP